MGTGPTGVQVNCIYGALGRRRTGGPAFKGILAEA